MHILPNKIYKKGDRLSTLFLPYLYRHNTVEWLLKMKKVLLIAGGGTLGTYVAEELLYLGHGVDIICLEDKKSDCDNLKYYKADANLDFLRNIFKKNHYNGIVNFIHYRNYEDYIPYFPRNGAVGTDSGRIANDAFVFFLDEIAVSVSVTLTWVADLILLIGLRNFLTSRADGDCFPICSQSVKKPSESVRGLRPLA